MESCVEDCPGTIYAEYLGIEAYADGVLARQDLREFITKRYLASSSFIDSERVMQMAYWYSGNYRSTGYADGLIALSLGLAEIPALEEKDIEV